MGYEEINQFDLIEIGAFGDYQAVENKMNELSR